MLFNGASLLLDTAAGGAAGGEVPSGLETLDAFVASEPERPNSAIRQAGNPSSTHSTPAAPVKPTFVKLAVSEMAVSKLAASDMEASDSAVSGPRSALARAPEQAPAAAATVTDSTPSCGGGINSSSGAAPAASGPVEGAQLVDFMAWRKYRSLVDMYGFIGECFPANGYNVAR